MSRVADIRTELFDALRAATVTPWRVSKYPPAQPVAPTVWLGMSELAAATAGNPGVSVVVIRFPVTITANGDDARQVEKLDDVMGAMWDAMIHNRYEPIDATPGVLDVGGPRLRSVIIRTQKILYSNTLCWPELELTTNG